MRFRTASVLSATALTAALLASGSAHAVERLPWDADFRIADLQQDAITVEWDAHPDARRYSVGVQPLEACDTYRNIGTEGLTATFSGLTPDCTYRIYVVAVLTATPVYLNPIATIEISTPPPDDYAFPEPPSDLRAEIVDGEVTGFAWDPVRVGVDPARYRIYAEPVLITNPFHTVTETAFDGAAFDDFILIIGAEGFSTVKVWVTTVDGIHNESVPSNEVVLSCRPERSLLGASCVPA